MTTTYKWNREHNSEKLYPQSVYNEQNTESVDFFLLFVCSTSSEIEGETEDAWAKGGAMN
jgi:hypothetical protein